MKEIINTAGGVGFSDWLGLFTYDSWFGFWRYRFLEAVMLCCLFALYCEVRVLVECYREKKESKRQADQRPSEPYKPASRKLCDLRSRNGNLNLPMRNFNVGTVSAGSVLRDVRDFAAKSVDTLLKFRRSRHRPNENKMSYGYWNRASNVI